MRQQAGERMLSGTMLAVTSQHRREVTGKGIANPSPPRSLPPLWKPDFDRVAKVSLEGRGHVQCSVLVQHQHVALGVEVE